MTDITPIHGHGGASGLGWSELVAYMRCPKEYQYARVRRVISPKVATPDPLAIGQMVHAGRAAWLAKKCAMDSDTDCFVQQEMHRACEEHKLPVTPQAEKEAYRIVAEYREHWSMREAPRTVATEHLLGPVTLWDGDEEQHARTARLDDFGYYPEAGGKLVIGELKTGADSPAQIMNEYQLHGQPLLQQLLWKRAPQGEATWGAIAGVVFDVIQKGGGGKKCQFARIFVDAAPYALQWYQTWLKLAIRNSRAVTWDSDEARNITACTRASGRGRVACTYRTLCEWGERASGDYTHEDGSPLKEGAWV